MAEYKGKAADAGRIQKLLQQREKDKKQFEQSKNKAKEASRLDIDKQFAAKTDTTEDLLKNETIGVVSLQDFKRKKSEIESAQFKAKQKQLRLAAQNKKKSQPRIIADKLSFDVDDEIIGNNTKVDTTKKRKQAVVEDEGGEDDLSLANTDSKKRRVGAGKNPFVDTSFLPDEERELEEEKVKEQLRIEWEQEQEKIKTEKIEVTYSYYDGAGHRKMMVVNKGMRIEQFLAKVIPEFAELKGCSTDHLMFIKEDVIIPQSLSFYDLIVNKAKGKSGPLWNWDVHEDVRMATDNSKEKDESHAAKVVERRWYEKHKHLFPASRWEMFDPNVERERYTIC